MTAAMLASGGDDPTADLANLSWWVGDPEWIMEQKANGDRMLVHFVDPLTYVVLNRNGEHAGFHIPKDVRRALAAFAGATGVILDGELVGHTWWVFDIAEGGNIVPAGTPWHKRRAVLERLFELIDPAEQIQLLPTARTSAEKQRLIERVVAARGEGFIGKDVNSAYMPAKSKTDRSDRWRKVKLVSAIDCVVVDVARAERDGTSKENYEVAVYSDGQPVEIGTVAWNDKRTRGRCQVGDVLEVRYLYTDTTNRLVQPRILRRRTDKAAEDCSLEQLRPPTDKGVLL